MNYDFGYLYLLALLCNFEFVETLEVSKSAFAATEFVFRIVTLEVTLTPVFADSLDTEAIGVNAPMTPLIRPVREETAGANAIYKQKQSRMFTVQALNWFGILGNIIDLTYRCVPMHFPLHPNDPHY